MSFIFVVMVYRSISYSSFAVYLNHTLVGFVFSRIPALFTAIYFTAVRTAPVVSDCCVEYKLPFVFTEARAEIVY